MVRQRKAPLFGAENPQPRDIHILLLDRVFGNLHQQEQIDLVVSTLLEEDIWKRSEKETIALVEVLKKLLSGNDIEFRAKLMKICDIIPMQMKGDPEFQEQVEVAANLRIAMLTEIIQGWGFDLRGGTPRLLPDAEICFRFVCKSFATAPIFQKNQKYINPGFEPENGRIRKGILQILRVHLEPFSDLPPLSSTGNADMHFYDLNPWILDKEIPEEIVLVLFRARTRLGGHQLKKEIAFLENFQLDHRSDGATQLANILLSQIRKIDELAQKVAKHFALQTFVSGTPLKQFDRVTWRVETPDRAYVIISFGIFGKPNPDTIAQIQQIRNRVLAEIDKPPKILIEASDEGFFYKEE